MIEYSPLVRQILSTSDIAAKVGYSPRYVCEFIPKVDWPKKIAAIATVPRKRGNEHHLHQLPARFSSEQWLLTRRNESLFRSQSTPTCLSMATSQEKRTTAPDTLPIYIL